MSGVVSVSALELAGRDGAETFVRLALEEDLPAIATLGIRTYLLRGNRGAVATTDPVRPAPQPVAFSR